MSLNLQKVSQFVGGKVVVVTGGGGSIGSAIAQALRPLQPNRLILLDHSERNLNEAAAKLGPLDDQIQISNVVGSVADTGLLAELFAKYHPEIVYHAAAFKHVPLMELNPLAAVQNNAIATHLLAKACRDHSVSNLVLISTDKAVNPISIMGVSKRVAELALRHVGDSNTRMTVIRLGNVLSTVGSVVPLFLDQIRHGGPVTVTDPSATRYFLTLEEAVGLILSASTEDTNGNFIPKVNTPVNIHEMALELIKNSKSENQSEIAVKFTGLRPGDKLSEEFLYQDEQTKATEDTRLLRVVCGARPSDSFDNDMEVLLTRVQKRDVAGTVQAVRRLVPEYQPSETVIRLSQELTA
jgi:FlaA1/EpsC-like NDP-sugar epimerase